MSLWRIYYHIVWTTKNRYPYITTQKEAKLYPFIINKINLLGCVTHAIGGIEDHLHLVVSIPPQLAIADFVKSVKGSSSHYLNQNFQHNPQFAWQEGYRVFSLGSKQLQTAIDYVNNQKEHHRNQTTILSLEKTEV